MYEQERVAFLRTAKLPELKRQIAATGVAIDALAYELYGLTEHWIADLRERH